MSHLHTNALWKAKITPPSSKLVLMYMAKLCDDRGERLFPSMADVAKNTNLSTHQVRKIIHSFVAMGVLTVEANYCGGKPGTTRHHRLHLSEIEKLIPKACADATRSIDTTPGVDAEEGVQGCTAGVASAQATASADATQITNKHQINTKQSPADRLSGFEIFWDAYPHKVKKGLAMTEFFKLRPSKEQLDTILQALSTQSASEAWAKEGGKYIPYPSNYLLKKQWEPDAGGYVPGNVAAWYSTGPGLIAKGKELGLHFVPKETSSVDDWLRFVARVWVAVGDGPHWDHTSAAFPVAQSLRDYIAPNVLAALDELPRAYNNARARAEV